jgi:hypothetical protein
MIGAIILCGSSVACGSGCWSATASAAACAARGGVSWFIIGTATTNPRYLSLYAAAAMSGSIAPWA